MKLLAAAFWVSWYAIQWCRVFGVGDQDLLMKMFWAHLVAAVLLSLLSLAERDTASQEQGHLKHPGTFKGSTGWKKKDE